MTHRITLSPAGLCELELVLAGALGEVGYRTRGSGGRLLAADIDSPAAVELLDEEGTPLAVVDVADVDDSDGTTLINGDVRQLRPFGHLRHRDLRAGSASLRAARAVVVLGDLPGSDDERWSRLDGRPVVMLDTGHDPERLAAGVRRGSAAGRDMRVLPAPDAALRPRDAWVDAAVRAAQHLIADEIEIWDTERAVGDGVVILLTGLSGSGKSTIAKLLAERLSAADERTVSLLDGDEVRLILSSGLGFSREDRIMNVRRIGWVAALIAKHGGVAVCAPIAPYASMRDEMRERVERVGRFVLVHVSTPLEVCEARDRKGLYAKARAGEIPQFTGISDPYEEPADADLAIDASVVSPSDAVDQIVAVLGR